MNRAMFRRCVLVRSALLSVAAPGLAQDRADAVLVLADDGALDPSAVRAIRSLTASELRKRGVAVSEDRRTEGVLPVDASLTRLADGLGAHRIFVLRIGGGPPPKNPPSPHQETGAPPAPVYPAPMTAPGVPE